jgi:membrane associated rhomboid family serine protease
VAAALATLSEYDQENRPADAPAAASAATRPMTITGVVVALLLLGFFAITGPRAGRSAWFEHGSADAARMVAGEWWRAVTALTLHADASHVVGNAIATAVLVTAVCWHLGSGVGVWLVLLAGAGGNALTAVAHGSHHVSVGASTATFGAIGILAALRVAGHASVAAGRRRWWIVIGASLALLALLGTGPDADLLAHLFGLLVGAGFGVVAALALREAPPEPLQWLLVAGAGIALLGAWRMAL